MKSDELISGLYAAATGRQDWEPVLANVADHLDLWLVQIGCIDIRTGQLVYTAAGGPGSGPAITLDYVRYYNTIDPRLEMLSSASPGVWVLSEQHHDDAFVADNSFYQEFLIPHGGGAMAGIKILELSGLCFMVAVVRRHGVAPLDPERMPFLTQFKHHLCEALRSMTRLREMHAELAMARDLLGHFDYPVLLVDEAHALWHSNRSAAALLDGEDLVRQQAGQLICVRGEDDLALGAAIKGISSLMLNAEERPPRRVIALTSTGGKRWLAFLSMMRPETTMGIFGTATRVLLVLHELTDCRSELDAFIVGECFDLTPAESRIAVQLADGMSAKQIAQRSDVALSTVRTQIKRIMEKTGTTRQAELLQNLLNLPLRAR